MSEWGIFTYLDGEEFDAINSLTEFYVIDVIQTDSSGSRAYPTSAAYRLDVFITNASNKYAGGGQYDVPATAGISGGVVSWRTDKPATIVVVMKNV